MYKILKFELINLNRSHHLIRISIYMLLLSYIVFSITIPLSLISRNIALLICFSSIIFTIIAIPHSLIKVDLNDGFLETMLSTTSAFNIIAAKYLAIVISLLVSILILLPINIILFQFSFHEALYLLIISFLTIIQISALIVFINIIHAYFRRNTNLLIAIILPLIIPTLILSSMGFDGLKFDFLGLLLGIDIILIPIICYLSTYLLEHIYDF